MGFVTFVCRQDTKAKAMFKLIEKLQEYRLNDQRCDPQIIAKTRDEQFFEMIFHYQSKRMNEQRAELPNKTPTEEV
ncbi:G-protein-signaling modulator 1-like [Dendronephthya gigantea]|uniref:G-protein-signaling modulator 1-like n=1 Tax=Dendronephthya gigantea TaxID=151771 RepID=UPI00106A89FD|nr:G-protein-signaling modulator 1-like [Dendronephthya gigantea]